MDYQNILEQVIEKVRMVGDYQVEKFMSRNFQVDSKSTDIDMVTEVDKQSEVMLFEACQTIDPNFGFLGEETGETSSESPYTWIIDPLDGTTNFSTGVPIFAISVGLYKEGQAVLGCVYLPMTGVTYTAIKGQGAYKNGQAIRVNSHKSLRQSLLATGFPYDRAENPINNAKEFYSITPRVKGIRRLGAAAYDLCLVAEGVFAGYWEYGIQVWDFAAGLLIAKEAGARYYDLGRRDHSMIVCNPYIFDELKEILD